MNVVVVIVTVIIVLPGVLRILRFLEERSRKKFKVHRIESEQPLKELKPGPHTIHIWLIPGARVVMDDFRVKMATTTDPGTYGQREELPTDVCEVVDVIFRGRNSDRLPPRDKYQRNKCIGWIATFSDPRPTYCRDESFRVDIKVIVGAKFAMWSDVYLRFQSRTQQLDDLMTCHIRMNTPQT